MKPNELRIGNFVRIKDNNTIVKVEAISRKKVRFFYGGDKSRSYYRRYSEIEPVLIREVYDSLPPIPDLMWADKTNCEDLYYYKGLVITDLHELQNLHYALAGEELKIEL